MNFPETNIAIPSHCTYRHQSQQYCSVFSQSRVGGAPHTKWHSLWFASLVPRPSHHSICRLVLQATNPGVRRPGYEADGVLSRSLLTLGSLDPRCV